MMAGYWKEPEMTEAAFDGGWFHTGDLGRSDDEGYYTIVDRKKDMVISGGFNVYSTEVEAVLMADPRILQAAVIGVPDPKWVEAVHAVIVIAEGQTIDAQEIKDLVREKKGAVYAPKGVEFIDALPQTATGKVDKKALRAPYWEGHERRI
jgi:fatty-acyl-CoA synthase